MTSNAWRLRHTKQYIYVYLSTFDFETSYLIPSVLCDYECPSSFANNDGHIYVIMYLQMSLFVICTSLQLSSYYFTHRLRHYDCRFLFNICQNIFVHLWFYHITHLLVSPETVQEKVSQWKYFFTYRNIFTQSGGEEEQSV